MQPPSTLPELVEQLGRTYSPFERLKILIRAWALLRKMTPQERMTVAAQLGLDHADDLVEAIAKRSGTQASPALISLIEKAQVKGTTQLPGLIADLRDPGKRAERLRQGAQIVLEEAAPAKPAPPVIPPPPAVPQPKAPPPPAPPAATAPPQPPAPPPPQAPAPVVIAAPEPPSPPPPAGPAPAPKIQETAPVSPLPKPQPAPPSVRPAETNPLAAQLTLASSLTARFHALRQHLMEVHGASAEQLRSVLEAFPDGWARRRALLELLRAGALASIRDALVLVESLASERDRLWCLGALADHHLEGPDREALLAAVPTTRARRRIEARLSL
jgi:hypothetical protein